MYPVAVGVLAVAFTVEVDPPEHEGRLADLERGEAALGVSDGDVTLEAGLVGAAPPDLRVALGDPPCCPAHLVETVVRPVDVGLLGGEHGRRNRFGRSLGGLVGHVCFHWGTCQLTGRIAVPVRN